VRITGGVWASRRVTGAPRGSEVRPTPDALREQAFAILRPHLEGARFLDLFAGTGVVSLEALSRGAGEALVVERAAAPLRTIRRNLEALAVGPERCRVLPMPAVRAIGVLAGEGLSCPVAWCDPPFAAWQEGTAALAEARARGVLERGALVVLEVPARTTVDLPGFETVRNLRGAALLAVR
jgi:16S rRNA (guanine966-N2)-methyltransferase